MNIKKLTLINFAIVTFFSLIYLQFYYRIDNLAVIFLKELVTIPFLISQVIFWLISIKLLANNTKKLYFILSFTLLTICSFLTLQSFF